MFSFRTEYAQIGIVGQSRVLRQFPSLESATDTDLGKIMTLREEMEIDLQAGPWMPYSEVLESSIGRAAQGALGLKLTGSECRAFSASQPGWPLFPDSSSVLGRLVATGPGSLAGDSSSFNRSRSFSSAAAIPPAIGAIQYRIWC